MRFTCALALASLLSSACGESERAAPSSDAGPDRDANSGPPKPELFIGKGETAYAPLENGEALPYEHGSQGGQHVYVSLRITGMRPERVLLEARTEVDGYPDLVLERAGRLTFLREPATDAGVASEEPESSAAGYLYIGWPAQILGAVAHVGETASIEMRATDLDGQTASARKSIVIAAP